MFKPFQLQNIFLHNMINTLGYASLKVDFIISLTKPTFVRFDDGFCSIFFLKLTEYGINSVSRYAEWNVSYIYIIIE